MNRDEMSNLYRGPSIDASYQVSVHLAEEMIKCEKLTDDRRRMPSDGKSSHCFWQGELKTLTVPFDDINVACLILKKSLRLLRKVIT